METIDNTMTPQSKQASVEAASPPPDHTNINTIQRYIRDLSTSIHPEQEDIDVDEDLLQSLLHQARTNAYGILNIEVYRFQDPRLIPEAWLCDYDDEPEIAIPGIDLVGLLWTQMQGNSNEKGLPRTSSFASMMDRSWSVSFRQKRERAVVSNNTLSSVLLWRDLQSVIDDPDVIHGPRLEELQTLSSKAAGIGFDTHGTQGMVVYYAGKRADAELLSSVVNETYLIRTAAMIGSALAMSEARRASVVFQRMDDRSGQDGYKINEMQSTPPKAGTNAIYRRLQDRVSAYFCKFWGAESQIPPGMPLTEALWTFLGVFVGLLIVSAFGELFKHTTDKEYYLIMGPFGALVTLQYGLTGSPAGQPRNAVLGHIVAGAISLVFTYIPGLPTFVRQILAPALSIGAMCKLGITNPPAGAFSVIFAEGNHNWGFYGIVVLCSIVSIIPATIVNNMSQKRQYPTYWGYARLSRLWNRTIKRKAGS